MLFHLMRHLRGETHGSEVCERPIRRLRLEVELLEERNLLSPVFFVPMNPIATGLGGSDITATVGDINGDGHLDVISTSSQTVIENVHGIMEMITRHAVVWYENNGAAAPSFTPHTIAVSNSEIPWVGVGDIDGNGTLDAVMEIDGQIWWYGNNGNGTVWTPHLVPGAQGDLSVWIVDVNGDGHNDLILPNGNTITWWENVDGTGTTWRPHVISDQVALPPPPPPPPVTLTPSISKSIQPGSGIVSASGDLYASPTGLGASGLDYTFGVMAQPTQPSRFTDTSLAVSVIHGGINILSVGDINGDGKLDVITSGDGSIQWWENPGSADGTWTRHVVHQGQQWGDVRMAFAQDMNGDGKLDIVSSGNGDVSWWENSAGDGSTWVRHTITSNDWNAQSITVGDISGNGRPDLFSFAPMSSVVTWYENGGGANPSFTPHTFSFPTGPGTVSLGDLTGDGRLDAIITPVFSNSISWFFNWDGQSPLPIPPTPTAVLPPGSGNIPPGTTMSALTTFVPPVVAGAATGSSVFSGSASTLTQTSISAAGNLASNSISASGLPIGQTAGATGLSNAHSPSLTGNGLGLAEATDLSWTWDIVPGLLGSW